MMKRVTWLAWRAFASATWTTTLILRWPSTVGALASFEMPILSTTANRSPLGAMGGRAKMSHFWLPASQTGKDPTKCLQARKSNRSLLITEIVPHKFKFHMNFLDLFKTNSNDFWRDSLWSLKTFSVRCPMYFFFMVHWFYLYRFVKCWYVWSCWTFACRYFLGCLFLQSESNESSVWREHPQLLQRVYEPQKYGVYFWTKSGRIVSKYRVHGEHS